MEASGTCWWRKKRRNRVRVALNFDCLFPPLFLWATVSKSAHEEKLYCFLEAPPPAWRRFLKQVVGSRTHRTRLGTHRTRWAGTGPEGSGEGWGSRASQTTQLHTAVHVPSFVIPGLLTKSWLRVSVCSWVSKGELGELKRDGKGGQHPTPEPGVAQ